MTGRYRRIIDRGFLDHCGERVRRILAYWDAKRGDPSMPARADIDPNEIRDLLPGIILIDVAHNPLRLTYRLVGSDEVEARGYNPTGMDVTEHVFAVTAAEGYRTYTLAIELRQPVYDEEPSLCANPRLNEVGSLVMPLSNDGETVNMVMAFIDYRRNQ